MDMQPNKGAERWTVRRLLQTTRDYLAKRGSASARLDAELLLAEALGSDRVGLYVNLEQPMLDTELATYRELVRRRGTGEPVAYILGRKEFFGLEIQVGPAVLVPRPETEVLVESVLAEMTPGGQERVLDVGTGSGAIALALLSERPGLSVAATDSSKQALAVAAGNARRLGLADRIMFREGALFGPIEKGERFAVIVSNPPYIPTAEFERLSAEVRGFEPRGALDGGPDGLAVIRPLVAGAAPWLDPGGLFALEMGEGQAESVFALAEAAGSWDRIEVRTDLAGIDRVLLARRRGP